MIIVDNIAEYETLSTIKNFCKNHDECKEVSETVLYAAGSVHGLGRKRQH